MTFIKSLAVTLLVLTSACTRQGDDRQAPHSDAGRTAAPQATAATTGAGGTLETAALVPIAPAANAPVGVPNFTTLVKREGPAVVNVSTTRGTPGSGAQQSNDPMLEFFRRFMPDAPGMPGTPRDSPQPRGEGLGSGFIISKDGYVLTNAHVVADSDTVSVRLADGKRVFRAKVVGTDRRTDMALLKIEADDLPTVTLGRSADVQVGEWVAAIGSPFGFANTITAGIVSATGRNLPSESFIPFIQTDVAVNPGNSGGPLLNLKGEVIGINSMIYSQTGGYMGVSFAIPIDVALNVTEQLRTAGKVTRGRIGVQIQPVTQELAKSFGLDSARGVLIGAVEKGGPADKAGLQAGDIILRYNDTAISEAGDLPRQVAATKPGSAAALVVWRKAKEQTLNVTVGSMPTEDAPLAQRAPAESTPNKLGLVVAELTPAERSALNIEFGVRVEAVQGPAAGTQIRRGDVILAVNDAELKSREQFNEIVTGTPKGVVALLVRRGAESLYIPVTVG